LWTTELQDTSEANECVYVRVRYLYSDDTWSDWIYVPGGEKGDKGTSVDEVIEYYQTSKETDSSKLSEDEWDTNIIPPSKEKPYLWNYEVSKYSTDEIAM
jgi:hypothetical protein